MNGRSAIPSRAFCAAAIALSSLGVGCGGPAAPPAFERPPPSVSAVAAEAKDVPVYLDEIGRCLASEAVTVSAQATGRITEVRFRDGSDVKAKDPLFTIDPRPYEARLASAEAAATKAKAAKITASARAGTAASRREGAKAQSASAKASAEAAAADGAAAEVEAARAKEDAQRVEQTASGAVSEQERTRVRSAAAAAASRLEAAHGRAAAAKAGQAEAEAAEKAAEDGVREAQSLEKEADASIASTAADVASATLDLEYCHVQAPIAGRAGRRLLDAGNVISSVGTPLLTIERYDPIHIEFTVTERDLSAVQRNLARGALEANAWLPDEPGVVRKGEVTFLDNAVDGATGTVRLRASLPNADGRFWPGRFAKLRLVLESLPGAVLVPATAPQTSAQGAFVYVVAVAQADNPMFKVAKGDTIAEKRLVVLGQRQEGLIVVSQGLTAGERVITNGQMAVMAGGKIHVVEAPPAPAGAQGAGAGR